MNPCRKFPSLPGTGFERTLIYKCGKKAGLQMNQTSQSTQTTKTTSIWPIKTIVSTNYVPFHCNFYSLIHINCFTCRSYDVSGNVKWKFSNGAQAETVNFIRSSFRKMIHETKFPAKSNFFFVLSNNSSCSFLSRRASETREKFFGLSSNHNPSKWQIFPISTVQISSTHKLLITARWHWSLLQLCSIRH